MNYPLASDISSTVYMDNHATTAVDPRVVDAMLPYFTERFGNSGSKHAFGEEAHEAIDAARIDIATAIGAKRKEIIFTSGATESNNLAIRGVAQRTPKQGNHLIRVVTEDQRISCGSLRHQWTRAPIGSPVFCVYKA